MHNNEENNLVKLDFHLFIKIPFDNIKLHSFYIAINIYTFLNSLWYINILFWTRLLTTQFLILTAHLYSLKK